ncbi:hypothetical protein F3Y22_tig00112281pilonHSYRG00211 [Hibiscus syriacus]|uniref:Uncharacterized protein n=1 Tax=Hibiscus syriacus TaxID=106335 RepID=A0A6A2Y726_HIBSY|nr:hypothetical protein F3Y22_tig00112281pilonHSYRG00211 [Hibiscus syriacus]
MLFMKVIYSDCPKRKGIFKCRSLRNFMICIKAVLTEAKAECLVGEIHSKEKELERLIRLWTKLDSSNAEGNAARNRFGRGSSDKGSSSDFSGDYHPKLPYYTGGRSENQQRLMLLRSAFVLYILVLHIVVFIRISF